MYKDVQIGDKTVGMLSTAASPLDYKDIFGKDFLTLVQSKEGPPPDIFVEIMFIFAKTAELLDNPEALEKLTRKDFKRWCRTFTSGGMYDLYEAIPQVQELIASSMKTTSVPKGAGV